MPYCPEIYKNVFIQRVNDDSVYAAPCCQAAGHVVKNNVFNFESDRYLSNLREQFSAGEKPEACNACWKVEKAGHKSRRQSAIEFHNNTVSDKTTLESMDLNMTWACNLACIMCGPQCSSTWAKELNINSDSRPKLGVKSQKNNDILESVSLKNIKKIHFNGGEPFINNDHLKILKKIKQQKGLDDVFVSYNTNGTLYPSNEIIDIWKQTDLVKIFFSIDAIDVAFNYIRYPASWKFVEKNILQMKESLPSNVMFGINATIGCYNLFEIMDVKNWFDIHLSTNREGDNSDFNWQIAENFHPKNLSQEIKHDIIQHLENDAILNNVCNFLKDSFYSEINFDWTNKLDKLDKRRNTDWKNSLMIGSYFKKC